ncbi:MAG: 6-phospho-beta-glucosidase [Firmicutes bacterium]|nr:6-phospho-beta-glucosidase [Bacillota bacterium]
MKKSCKVVAIGGGSSYTPELIEGLINRHHELPVAELWLVDVEAGKNKLAKITALARRMIAKAGLDITVHSSFDRELALAGADFVLTQFRVGQLEARILDESIPAKYGLLGQETNGAGGLFKGLRTIPIIFDIINDCQRLCPDAWIISFTNPAGMITEAVFRHTQWKKFIGLCNLPIGMEMAAARMFGVEKSRVRMDIAGLNHMVFGLDVYLDGKSVLEETLAKMGKEAAQMSMNNVTDLPWSHSFLKGLGAIPCAYHRYYWLKQGMLSENLKDYQAGVSRGQQVKTMEAELFRKYADPNLADKPAELEQRGGAYYSDAACDLITSIYTDKQDIQVVNTVNNGAISSLPDDVVVEVSSLITKDGPRPITMGSLPVAGLGLIQQMKAFEILACEAAMSGSYETALVAMVTNPLVQDERIARQVLDEMLLAHKDYLPQFQEVVKHLEACDATDS